MALFKKKKEEQKEDDIASEKNTEIVVITPKKVEARKAMVGTEKNLSGIIRKPRITEKAAQALDTNVYTFEVRKDASKYDIRDAVKQFYGVTPIKIRTVTKRPRHYTSRMRGRDMMEKGLKKAYVYLKKGDRIDLA